MSAPMSIDAAEAHLVRIKARRETLAELKAASPPGYHWVYDLAGKANDREEDSVRRARKGPLPCGCHCDGGCISPYSPCAYACKEHVCL